MYLFDGNAVVINVRAESGNKYQMYPKILKRAIIFDITLFILFSSMCYSVFREQTQPIFTMSLRPINGIVVFIFICVCINALTSFPMQILSAFAIIEKFEFFHTEHRRLDLIKKISARALIIILTTFLCMGVKTFTDFINISGALGAATVSFILPQLFYMREFKNDLALKHRVGCWLILIFGIVGSSYSIYFSVRKLAKGDLS